MCDIHSAIVSCCELSVCMLCAAASCLCAAVSCLCAAVYCTRTHELESESQLKCSCVCLYHKTCVSQALGKAAGIHCRHWEEQEKAAGCIHCRHWKEQESERAARGVIYICLYM